MSVTLRNYSPEPFFTDDYRKVREFLININSKKLTTHRMLWGAWEWAVTHGGRDQSNLGKIGLWEDDGELVALATYECPLGEGFLCIDENYAYLKPELVAYAKENLHDNGKLVISLPDGDNEFTGAAIRQGFFPTMNNDHFSLININELQPYSLPDGFSFVSMADGWNWHQYNRVMWRGFDHGSKQPYDDETISMRKQMLSSPMVIPELVVAIKAPDGNFVSHCGMWYRPGDFYCELEPLVTDPDYRKMGLGRAAVLEAARRCGKLGAKQVVGAINQQFYCRIGFYPIQTFTYWELK
jgi:GNAT superfamily N-acetyltransferase